MKNEKIIINNSLFIPNLPPTQPQIEMQRENDQRKVTREFHEIKGSKFDVEIAEEDKHSHVADRLGHPEVVLSPIQSLLRLDTILSNQSFKNQPFIKIPGPGVDPDVCLKKGDVIYENEKIHEWKSLVMRMFYLWVGFYFTGYINVVYFFVATPSMEHAYKATTFLEESNPEYFDPRGIYTSFFVGFQSVTMLLLLKTMRECVNFFPSKIQYNKNKDVVFVDFLSYLGGKRTEAMEVDHLERSIPVLKSKTNLMMFGNKGISIMDNKVTMDTMYLFNEDHYWPGGLREEFLGRTTNLIDKNFAKDGFFERYS